MSLPTGDKSDYRACAAAALFNPYGKVWLGRRVGTPEKTAWQLPQGGIDKGETPEFAAIRELSEETGASVNLLSPLGEIDDWLYYDIPGGSRRGKTVWRGQRQKWYALRWHGSDDDFNLRAHLPAEFSEFRWADLSEITGLIVPFKRKVYARVTSEFEGFARGAK